MPMYTPSAYQPWVLIRCFKRPDSVVGAAASPVGEGGGEGAVEYARRLRGCCLLPRPSGPGGERVRAACRAVRGRIGVAPRAPNIRNKGILSIRNGAMEILRWGEGRRHFWSVASMPSSAEFASQLSSIQHCHARLLYHCPVLTVPRMPHMSGLSLILGQIERAPCSDDKNYEGNAAFKYM